MNNKIEYKFVTVKDLIHSVCDKWSPNYPVIGFTFDTPEDLGVFDEPESWYGVGLTSVFDGVTFVIGYWGGGIMVALPEWDEEDCVKAFIRFMKTENNRTIDENTLICVDAKEYEDAKAKGYYTWKENN